MLDLHAGARGVECWAPEGEVGLAVLGDQEVVVAYDQDVEEARRRAAAGVRPVLERRTLQVLLDLPQGSWVSLSLLRPADQSRVRRLPRGLVAVEGDGVMRLARPALAVRSIGVAASTWRRGLRLSAPYASYCSRYVLLQPRRARGDLTMATLEARYYGVGLAVAEGDSLDWLVAPAPFAADRFSASSWLLAEQVADALV